MSSFHRQLAARARELALQLSAGKQLDAMTRSELTSLLVNLARIADQALTGEGDEPESTLTRRTDLGTLITRPGDQGALLASIISFAAQRPPGDLLSVRDLRKFVRGQFTKDQFDKAALSLMRAREIGLHYTDFPWQYKPAELAELIDGGNGIYYIGIALKE